MKKLVIVLWLAASLLSLGACSLIDLKPGNTEEEVLENPDFVPPSVDIYGSWYASPENGGEVYVFNEDGTCIINGETCTWNVWREEENILEIECSNGMWVSVANWETGMPVMYYNDLTFVPYPVIWEFCGHWETDRGRGAYLNEYEVQFFDCGYMELRFDTDGETVTVTAVCEDGSEQSLFISYVDGYPVAERTDADGVVTLFYRPENRPEIDYTELAYQDAVEKFNVAIEGGYIRYEEGSNMVKSGCGAYEYLYGLFEELGDYKDSKEYLSKFKVIEDVLVKRTRDEETFTSNIKQFGEHDSFGRRITGMVMDSSELGFYATGYFYTNVYGEDGRISKIITHDGDETDPVAWGIPTYDEMGNMVSLDITWNNPVNGIFNYTSVFTYDEFGRKLTAQIPEPLAFTTQYYWYYYDEDGKLIQITEDRIKNGNEKPSSREIYEYIYDENGFLIEKLVHRNAPGDGIWVWEITDFTYINDENGKPLSRTYRHGYVRTVIEENGNAVQFESTEEKCRFVEILETVFGESGLSEHQDWVIDTTGYELILVEDLLTDAPVTESYVQNYLYTDVYIYCPEE